MRNRTFLSTVTVALLSIMLLATGAAAQDYNDVVDKDSDTPAYLQLMAYVSQLLTAGQEVPKQLLHKIEVLYKQGK